MFTWMDGLVFSLIRVPDALCVSSVCRRVLSRIDIYRVVNREISFSTAAWRNYKSPNIYTQPRERASKQET